MLNLYSILLSENRMKIPGATTNGKIERRPMNHLAHRKKPLIEHIIKISNQSRLPIRDYRSSRHRRKWRRSNDLPKKRMNGNLLLPLIKTLSSIINFLQYLIPTLIYTAPVRARLQRSILRGEKLIAQTKYQDLINCRNNWKSNSKKQTFYFHEIHFRCFQGGFFLFKHS